MKSPLTAVITLCLLLTTWVGGQRIDREDLDETRFNNLTEAPASHLLDRGDIFAGKEAERSELVKRLQKLETDYKFSVYFVAYSGIIGSDVQQKAHQFRDLWLGTDKEGLIYVCDTDMKTMAYAITKVDGLPALGPRPQWKLPDHEAIAAMQAVSETSAAGLSEKQYLQLVGSTLVDELEKRLQGPPEAQKKRSLGLLLWLALTAALVSVSFCCSQKTGQRSSRTSASSFPEVPIPSRLGAPFGGGQVGEISFRSNSPSNSP